MIDRTKFVGNIAIAICSGSRKKRWIMEMIEARQRAEQVADALPQLFTADRDQ